MLEGAPHVSLLCHARGVQIGDGGPLPPLWTLAEAGFGHLVVPLDGLAALEAASRESRAPTAATVPPRRWLPTWSSSRCRCRVLATLNVPGYTASCVVMRSALWIAEAANCAGCALP